MKNILFVASEPKNLHATQCLDEHDHLQETRINAPLREGFGVTYLPNVTSDKMIKYLRKISPEFVHYCGHGNKEGEIQVSQEDGKARRFNTDILIRCLQRNHRLECVVFCSCNSAELLKELVEVSNYAIGFKGNVTHSDMHQFTSDFYEELFNVGSTYHAYLNTIDRIYQRGQQGNYLILKSKLKFVMKNALNDDLSAAQANLQLVEKEISITDQAIHEVGQSIEIETGAYSREFYEVIEHHPAGKEVIWFSNNRDLLASKVASTLYRGKKTDEIESFTEEVKLLYLGFEAILLYYENNAEAIEIFKIALGACPIQDYIQAIHQLEHVDITVAKSKDFELLFSKSIVSALGILTNLTS
jgi:hypothetical protein